MTDVIYVCREINLLFILIYADICINASDLIVAVDKHNIKRKKKSVPFAIFRSVNLIYNHDILSTWRFQFDVIINRNHSHV